MKYAEMNLYTIASIEPHYAGFGMYQANPDNEQTVYDHYTEIFDEEYFELGVDKLPKGVEDIRGHIYNEPDVIFAYYEGEDEYGNRVVRYIGFNNYKEITQ